MKKITLLAMSLMMTLFVKAQNGTDVTDLLTNPDFENDATGWTIVGGNKIAATAANYGYNGTKFIENWVAAPETLGDQSWSQTIEVPNGVYVVRSLAHAILQSDASVVPSGVAIYANKDEVAVTTTNTNPPTEYSVATVVTDGKLALGYRISKCNINWAAWDNVRLIQYVADTEEEAKTLWIKDELYMLADQAEGLLGYTMQMSLAENIGASIEAIDAIATFAAGEALLAKLKGLLTEAELSIEAYEHLSSSIQTAWAETEKGYEQGLSEFEIAINAAQAYYDNAEGNVEGVEAAIAKLNDALFTFQMMNADGTIAFDVTEMFMTNPSMRKGNQGWSGSAPGLEHEVMEFYNCDFDMYQTLTNIPNGMYKVRVQGFYRVGGNDGGAAYTEGTENISAQLYANNASAPLLSLYKYPASTMGVTSAEVTNDYLNMRVAVNEAFNITNPELDMPYYAENEVTVVVQDGTLKLGLRNSGHQSTSWCAFRDFKLDYYGNFPEIVMMIRIEEAQTWLDQYTDILPQLAINELSDAMIDAEEYTAPGVYSEEEVNAAIAEFEGVLAGVQHVIALKEELSVLRSKAEELMELGYPGLDALSEAYEIAAPFAEDGAEVEYEEGITTEMVYIDVVEEFKAAINAYYQSQEYSRDTPADFTYLIPNPNFEAKGEWTWSMISSGKDLWIGPKNGDNIIIPSEVGGDPRFGINLWGTSISAIDVHQELTGLPNGLYKVSAELVTQIGFATDQHVYAIGVSKTTSKNLEVEGWDDYMWEELTTTDFAVVIDGKLTIGAEASQGGSNSEGWFQATNFKLHYYGPTTDADLEAAWIASLERAETYANILLPGDSKDVEAAIKEAESLAGEGKYAEACASLNPIVAASDSIYNATQKFYNGNYQALIDLSMSMDSEICAYSLQAYEATTELVDDSLSASGATHKILGGLDTKLGGYIEYISVLIDVENLLADGLQSVSDEQIATMKEQVIAQQVETLSQDLQKTDVCHNLAVELHRAVKALEGAKNVNLPVGDLTEDLIQNSTIDDGAATGWTFVKGTGQNGPTNSGQHYDGTAGNIYLDCWNPNVGALNVTFYQEIFGLPDGTYQLLVAARADGENSYAFAAPEKMESESTLLPQTTQFAMIKKYYADHGEIWYTDSLAWVASDGTIEAPYFNANDGKGWGWSYDTINVEVTQHYLAIGLTANSALTGKESFNGTWLSADDWKLTLVTKAAVQSDYNPFTGIDNVEAIVPAKMGIYDLFGRRIDTPTAPGIYIIDSKKTLIKK